MRDMMKNNTKYETKGMLHKGLKDRSTKRPDKSMEPPSGSVNDGVTRSSVGDNTSLTGGRTA